jgi:hypothetical protein
VDYDHHEDFRFPIGDLHKGLYVLETYGFEKFARFCEKRNMPMQDQERVFYKHAYNKDPAFKAKIDEKIKAIKEKIGVRIKI